MSKVLRIAVLILGLLVVLILAFVGWRSGQERLPRAHIVGVLEGGEDASSGVAGRVAPLGAAGRDAPAGVSGRDAPPERLYKSASPDYALSFPVDFGAHPDYQTEWWYYTGNLSTLQGRRFGYQLTFFRRALVPPQERIARASYWGVEQVYLAHFALSEIQARRFHAFEELARGAAGLAGAQALPFQVWLYDWQVTELESGIYQLRAAQDGYALELTLTEGKGPVLQGIDGYSQKGPEPGNASHYFSQTRLVTQGFVEIQGERHVVSGTSWMDHEFSTSALTHEQVGWDWFSIQLDNETELMAFQIRREDGSIDPFSSATLVQPDGSTQTFARDDFTIQVLDTWKSPHSGATYPSRWRLSVPQAGLVLEIEPHQSDQELNVSYSYWEGAVRVSGTVDGVQVSGNGYVELTGYAGSMAGEF